MVAGDGTTPPSPGYEPSVLLLDDPAVKYGSYGQDRTDVFSRYERDAFPTWPHSYKNWQVVQKSNLPLRIWSPGHRHVYQRPIKLAPLRGFEPPNISLEG